MPYNANYHATNARRRTPRPYGSPGGSAMPPSPPATAGETAWSPYAHRQRAIPSTRKTPGSGSLARPSRHPARRQTVQPTPVGGTDSANIDLSTEFERVKTAKPVRRRRPRSKVTKILGAVALLLLVVGAAIIGPIIYEGSQAYQDVFVDRDDQSQLPAYMTNDLAIVVPTPPKDGGTVAPAPTPVPIPEWDGTVPITILLLGVDRRKDEPSRSDTMILVRIDPETKTASMIAIPRDMKVIIPGYGFYKINAAYSFGELDGVPGGGAGLARRTIEANFGIRVDHYAEVDFNGFVKIIDTIGGITVDVPYPIKDDAYPGPGNQYMRVYFTAGWQNMDGERALQYSRTRHDDGDTNRSRRQEQVILSIRQQSITANLLPKARELITEAGDTVRTDLSFSQALQLARLGTDISGSAITQASLIPALTEQHLPGEPYYLIPDWTEVGSILSRFTGGTVIPPALALQNPEYGVQIRVVNASDTPELGQTFADLLATNGFYNVIVEEASLELPDRTSTMTSGTDSFTTAMLVAGICGVSPSIITADQSGNQIVVMLGNDTIDPSKLLIETADTLPGLDTGPTPTPAPPTGFTDAEPTSEDPSSGQADQG